MWEEHSFTIQEFKCEIKLIELTLSKVKLPDNTFYHGKMEYNKKNGIGILKTPKNETFYGFFKEDEIYNFGIYVNENNSQYHGFWQNNKQHGYGEETW